MALSRAWLAALVACSSHGQPQASADIAIVDVTVVPMDRESELPHQTVIVRGDRITAIGPSASTTVAGGATRIDGRGKFLIPGLADMHVHTFDPRQLALFATEGVTTIRIMWGFPAALGVRNAIRNGEARLAPTIVTAGSIIDGEPPIWPGSTGVATPEQATAAVESQQRAGYDFIKVYSKLSPEAYAAIVAAAARLGVRVIGHVPMAVGLAGVLDAKQASIEHLDGYAWFARRADAPAEQTFAARMRAWQSADPAKLADAIARTKAAGTWNCPTLIVTQRLSNMDQPTALERPENRLVSLANREQWDPTKDFRLRMWTADDFEAARGNSAWQRQLVKRLADAGANLMAGTDVGNPWLVPGYSLHEELTLLVASGLTPYQALRAATAGPASFLHDDTFGTIAAGRRADLVLVDGDPLADIHNTAQISGVMLRGRWLPATALRAEQDKIAAIYRGDRSRFDTAQVLPQHAIFHARYQYAGGGTSGEERIVATPGQLAAEVRADDGADQRVEIELGPDGTGQRIYVAQDGLDATLKRDRDKVHLTAKLGGDTLDITEPIAADEILGGEPVVADTVFMRRLQTLAVDQQTTLKLAVLTTSPRLGIERLTIDAKRLPDGKRTIGKQTITTHEFAISHKFGAATIALDEAGWPVATQTASRIE